MSKIRTLFVAALAGTGLLLALQPAGAEDLDKATQDAFQAIITAQIDALGHDDSSTAESFASPGIRSKFPNPQDFLAMVKNSYGALIRPKATHFDQTGSTALGPLQKVTIVDSEGQAWTAVYTFEQVDGQWRISGCVLVKEQGTTI